jgi:AcrR family transcriptional regulator
MLALLPGRGWDDLNVQEICERANVGRSTFYMHYRGKDDLLAEGLNDLRSHLGAAAMPAQEAAQPLAFMAGLLQHMVEQRTVFRAVIGKRSGHVIERRFRDMVLQLVEDDFLQPSNAGWQQQMAVRYVAGALVDVMAWWVDAPRAPTPQALELRLRQLAEPALAAANLCGIAKQR